MHEWLRLEDVTISMMQYFKDVFNKKFGNDCILNLRMVNNMENKFYIEIAQYQSVLFKRIKSEASGAISNLNKEPLKIEVQKYLDNYLMVVDYNGLMVQSWVCELIVTDKDGNEISKFSKLKGGE